jgi:hypothetical protein
MSTQSAAISLPLTGLKPLYRNDEEGTLVVELRTNELKSINQAKTIDEIISQARLDYALGDYETFKTADDLIADLKL